MSKRKETVYFKTVQFKFDPSYEERESVIRRCIYTEQSKYKLLRWIVVEKDMKSAKIKFFAKSIR
jgi:hypothetical protein